MFCKIFKILNYTKTADVIVPDQFSAILIGFYHLRYLFDMFVKFNMDLTAIARYLISSTISVASPSINTLGFPG